MFSAFPPLARAIKLSALLCLMAGSASAQPVETVTVNDNTLSGLWKIAVPESVGINFFQHATFGPMKNIFCRIGQTGTALEIYCLNGGYSKSGRGIVEGNGVHLVWSGAAPIARFLIDGTRGGSTMDSRFTFQLAGIPHEDDAPSHSDRLAPPIAAPDAGGKSALLRAVLEGQPVPHDETAITKNEGALPGDIGKLGAIQVIAYLGQSPRLSGEGLDFFSVYAVEFDSGERICGLHQRADGVLDAFLCL